MSWVTLDEVRDRWADAPEMDDVLLTQYVDAAQEACTAYAPTLPAGATVPAGWREAVVLQTRAIAQAYQRDGDVLGFNDGFALRVRPLGAEVKALLRPRRAVPVLG